MFSRLPSGKKNLPNSERLMKKPLKKKRKRRRKGPLKSLPPLPQKEVNGSSLPPVLPKEPRSASQVPVHSRVPPFITRPPLMRVAIFIQELILSSCLPINQATTLLLLVTAASSVRYANRKVKLFPIVTSFPPPKGN